MRSTTATSRVVKTSLFSDVGFKEKGVSHAWDVNLQLMKHADATTKKVRPGLLHLLLTCFAKCADFQLSNEVRRRRRMSISHRKITAQLW